MDTIFRIPEDMYGTAAVGTGRSFISFDEDLLIFTSVFELYTPMDGCGNCKSLFPDPRIVDYTMESLSELYAKWRDFDIEENGFVEFFDNLIFKSQSASILYTSQNYKGYYYFPKLGEIYRYQNNDYTLEELATFLVDRLVIKG